MRRPNKRWADARQRAEKAYRNDKYPPRECDRCGKVYRGPAVYCSLQCAELDAFAPPKPNT
jgi:uncharacterized OB-fold protein